MTYSLTSWGIKMIPVLWGFPLGFYDAAGTSLHCYRIEIDSNSMVQNYKKDSSARNNQYKGCVTVFKNEWELPDLEIRAMRNIPTIMVSSKTRTNRYGDLETPYRDKVTNNDSMDSLYRFKEGDLIIMTTNKGITIASTQVTSLKIAVVESDSTKIKGRLSGFLSDVDETMENEIGSTVEIMRVDIENIWIEEIRP